MQNGFTVLSAASDGPESYEKILALRPDIVLIDIEMPGMTGLEVIREIRKKDLPVVFIIISSYNDFSYAQDALRLDVEDYLLKPFRDGELEAVVERIQRREREERHPAAPAGPEELRGKSKYVMEGLKQLPEELFTPAREMQSMPRWDRMRPLISYPFRQEKELVQGLFVPGSDIRSLYQAFIEQVQQQNKSCVSMINCYIILYVELQRQSESYDEVHTLDVSALMADTAPVQAFEQLLWRLCQTLQNRRNSGRAAESVIASAVRYIETHYAEKLTLNEVANYIGVTPSYLSSQFSQIMNLHFVDYIHKIRIDAAKDLLRKQPYLKGYELAEMVGYPSIKYFSEIFKKTTGITFNSYRAQANPIQPKTRAGQKTASASIPEASDGRNLLFLHKRTRVTFCRKSCQIGIDIFSSIGVKLKYQCDYRLNTADHKMSRQLVSGARRSDRRFFCD